MLSNFASAASKISSAVGLSSCSAAGNTGKTTSKKRIVRAGRRTGRISPCDRLAAIRRMRKFFLSLRLHHHRRADMRGVEKLPRFPIGHPDASVRRGNTGQIALVQSISRRELEKVRHRRAYKFGMRRLRIFPHVHVWPDDPARLVVNIGAVEAGSMILVFADDAELTNRRSVPF